MVAIRRSVAVGVEDRPGQNAWAVLCRAALRGIDWAAAACGVKELGEMDRSERLASYGGAPEYLPVARRPIDWAKLDTFDRGRLAREARSRWLAGEPFAPRRGGAFE